MKRAIGQLKLTMPLFAIFLSNFSFEVHAAVPTYLPTQEDEVLEIIRNPLVREISSPTSVADMAQQVRRDLDLAHTEGDARYVGRAQAKLGNWWADPNPPSQLRLLRAIIQQYLHRFDESVSDLSTVLKDDPQNSQALLSRALVYLVQGRYQEAQQDCMRLYTSARDKSIGAKGMLCIAASAQVTGKAEASIKLLSQSLAQDLNPEDQAWAFELRGEAHMRIGQNAEAERDLIKAIGLHSNLAKIVLASHYLDRKAYARVNELLQESDAEAPPALPILLIRTIASKKSHHLKEQFLSDRQRLQDIFDLMKQRGETGHDREEGRFLLDVLNQPEKAHEFALKNWQYQRESEDARLLLRTSVRTHDGVTLEILKKWLKSSKLQDPEIHGLLLAREKDL